MRVVFGPAVAVELLSHIERAQKQILLVTPYFDPWPHLTMAIRRAIQSRGVRVLMILRGGTDRAAQARKAEPFVQLGVKVRFVERLHAKIYICDETAFVTSLNLLRSSMEGSWEAASIFSQRSDPRAMADLMRVIKQLSTLIDSTPSSDAPAPAVKAPARLPPEAHCIRCDASIKLDPERPYCQACYKSWARWGNPEYEERHCHRCGCSHATSLLRPLCRSCYRKGSPRSRAR